MLQQAPICTPKLFQKRMSRTLEGIKGVLVQIDHVLIFGATQEEHDASLMAALKRLHGRSNRDAQHHEVQVLINQQFSSLDTSSTKRVSVLVPRCVADKYLIASDRPEEIHGHGEPAQKVFSQSR